jgi:hypothetical protein
MENRIKEQQLGLFIDRTSARHSRAYQSRLLLSCAYPYLSLFFDVAVRLKPG